MKRRARDRTARWLWAILLTGGMVGLLLAGVSIDYVYWGPPDAPPAPWFDFDHDPLYSTIGGHPLRVGQRLRLGYTYVSIDWSPTIRLFVPGRKGPTVPPP
jgi:hypothetical protein